MDLIPADQLTDEQLYEQARQLTRLASPIAMAADLDDRFEIRAHTLVIADALAKVLNGEIDRLIINTPPQIGKSTTVINWGALWWLANNPTHRVIVGSYSDDLAVRGGRAVRDLIEEHSATLGLQLKYGSTAAKDWSLTTGGGMRSVSIGSGITGHRANLLLIDDPHKDRAEAESVKIRNAVSDWFSSSALSRLAPGAPVVMIMTRWHMDDLAGRLIQREGITAKGGRWMHINMPALCDDPKTDPLGRAHGDPIPHPAIDAEDRTSLLKHWYDKKATSSVRDWFALYQGDPKPVEGALLTAAQLIRQRDYQTTATPVKHAVAIDPSGGGRDSAGIIAGYLADDGRLYISHDKTIIGDVDDWTRIACQLAEELDAEKIVIESNFGGDMGRRVIRTAWTELGTKKLCPSLDMVYSKKGKLLRAEPIAQQFKRDKIRLASDMPELEQEWQTWQSTDPDSPGRIDASVHLAYSLLPIPGAELLISSPSRITTTGRRTGRHPGPIQVRH